MPKEPTFCQTPTGGCEMPRSVRLTYRTAPLAGRHAGPGLTLTVAVCGGHVNTYTDLIRKEGGDVVSTEEIPVEAPIEPEPIGLDAVTAEMVP